MPPHHEYFWAALALIAVLALLLLVRLFPKRTNLSPGECARRDAGGSPPEEHHAGPEPKPPPDEKV